MKLSENQKITLTIKQLKRLVKESRALNEEDTEERNPSLMMCDKCGHMFSEFDMKIIDHKILCPRCAKRASGKDFLDPEIPRDRVVKCDDCGDYVDKYDITVIGDDVVCGNCKRRRESGFSVI